VAPPPPQKIRRAENFFAKAIFASFCSAFARACCYTVVLCQTVVCCLQAPAPSNLSITRKGLPLKNLTYIMLTLLTMQLRCALQAALRSGNSAIYLHNIWTILRATAIRHRSVLPPQNFVSRNSEAIMSANSTVCGRMLRNEWMPCSSGGQFNKITTIICSRLFGLLFVADAFHLPNHESLVSVLKSQSLGSAWFAFGTQVSILQLKMLNSVCRAVASHFCAQGELMNFAPPPRA
jgi:hypothetical protein